MKTGIMAMCLILVLGLTGSAVGGYIGKTWGGGSESWTTLSKWYDQGTNGSDWVTAAEDLPTSADAVNFGGDRTPGSLSLPGTLPTGGATIGAGVSAVALNVNLFGRWTPQNMTVTVESGGTLTTAAHIIIGLDWDAATGSPDNSAHTVTTAGTIDIGTSLLVGASNGGGTEADNSYGVLDITGGVVKVNDSIIFIAGQQTPYIQISGAGELWWSGSHTPEVNGWLGTNIIGTGLNVVEEGGWTKVLIPEPATVAILGLGSLVLLRRRRV
jgi:hypothetical protein